MGSKKKGKCKLCKYHRLLSKLKKKKRGPLFAPYAKIINKKLIKNYHDRMKRLEKEQAEAYPNHIKPKFDHDLFPIKPIVCLGCLSNQVAITDIVPINISGEAYQKWGNLNTPGSNNTPFQSNVYLTTNTDIYNPAAIANNYASVTLSQEGLLWTLWPLVPKTKTYQDSYFKSTYFNHFTMGTSRQSNYPLGQVGFFINSLIMAYTPIGVSLENGDSPGILPGQPGLKQESPSIATGIQGLENTFIQMRIGAQQVGIVVVKVSEEIARVFNPIAGVGSPERYIYIGYDGWAVFNLTTNPIGPMMASTYLTPQTVTGSVVKNNYQVVVPPNFPTTIYYKNKDYSIPISANNFLGA